jgi:hypothetical protein
MYSIKILGFLFLVNIYNIYCKIEYSQISINSELTKMYGMLIALKCYQPEFGFWSSNGLNNGVIEAKENRYFVRKGFIGEKTISLESSVNKGYFWRVKNGQLILETNDGSNLFKEESSFIPVPGLEDYLLLSLRSFKYPKQYVRHRNGRIIISADSFSLFFNPFSQDATWRVYTDKDIED